MAALLLVVFVFTGMLEGLEYRMQDAAYQNPRLIHPDIVIFGIDEAALDMFGAWPWPRSVMAEAIDILNTYDDERPAVIGIDVMYTEPSRFMPWGDYYLVEAARLAGNVVLASSVHVGIDPATLDLEPTALSIQVPFAELYPYIEHGLINAVIDGDGIIRNALLWDYFDYVRYYSFPVKIAMMYQGVVTPDPFIVNNPSMFLRYSGNPGIDGHPGDFFEASFADIFEPWFEPWWYADMIVLIGPYAIGMMDHHPVPIMRGAPMYGVEIHANAIQAILDEAFILPAPEWIGIAIIIAFLLLGMLLGEFADIKIWLVTFIVFAVSYYFIALGIFNRMYFVLPILGPPLILGVIAIYQLIYGYILHVYEKGKLRSAFMKYVDPKLVNKLIETGEADSNEVGSKRHIAVLFVDVRGFTPMTEKMRDTPEKIVETLNNYLELTSASVFNNGGSVDKFIGDATMALFNGFVPQEDHVYYAVKAAWDMVLGAAEVNALIKEQFGIELGFGIGVHCGEAIVGNLGPSFRKDYTAIGDTVNTAARLESNSKPSQVLISRDVYDMLEGRITAESVGEMPLKGKSVPLEIFSLTGVN